MIKNKKYPPEELDRGKPYDYKITLSREDKTGRILFSYSGYRTRAGVREPLVFSDGSMDMLTPQHVLDSKEDALEVLANSLHMKSISIRIKRR